MATAAERGSAAIRCRHVWHAEAAMGAVIRSALARAGVDAAQATRLCVADEAAACADDHDAAPVTAHDGTPDDAFAPKILAMTRRFTDGEPPDFANASFAELFAWSLAQPAAE